MFINKTIRFVPKQNNYYKISVYEQLNIVALGSYKCSKSSFSSDLTHNYAVFNEQNNKDNNEIQMIFTNNYYLNEVTYFRDSSLKYRILNTSTVDRPCTNCKRKFGVCPNAKCYDVNFDTMTFDYNKVYGSLGIKMIVDS